MTNPEPTPPMPGPRLARDSHQSLSAAVAHALVGGSLMLSGPRLVIAQAQPERAVEEIVVVGEELGDRRESSLVKFTELLRDTPQSITSLSATVLEDRNLVSLNDALRTVPSITLGAGEFSWQGNNPSIRGFGARDDMYLDGLRDFGSYPRDPFNLERVEVLLGPSSVLFGRGSTGGAINQVSKRPILDPLTTFSANVGSDQTLRSTMDLSRPLVALGTGAAFRLNVLAHSGEVADRDGAQTERFGFAPSLAFGLGSATQLTLSYMKQTADDRPDYGLPWLNGRPADVPRHNYYGFEDDYLETDADILTAELAHVFTPAVSGTLQVRYADYSRESRITEPLITDPDASNLPLTDISVFRYVFLGESDESFGTVQGTLHADMIVGNTEHSLVTGFELSRESSEPTYAFGIGVPETSLLSPDWRQPFSADAIETRVTADTSGNTIGVYVLDTLKLSDTWQVVLGARWDRFETDYDAMRFAGTPTPFNAGDVSGPESFDQVDDVLSYRAAVVFKPSIDQTWYLAGSTSFNPSAQSLSLLSTGRGLGVSNALLDPEENRSLEAGYKADLAGGELAFGAALFEVTKTNARIPDPTNPGFNTLGGEQRVRGFSVDIDGTISDKLYILGGYTYLHSEVVRGAPGAATGAALANAPEHSLSAWGNYQLTDRLDIGAGARYVSEALAQNTGAGKSVPAYWVLDAMARYQVSDALTLKLNLANLTDEYYFEQLHPWHVIPGSGFTATFAVNYTFQP